MNTKVFTMDDVVAMMAMSHECSEATAENIVRCAMFVVIRTHLSESAPQREKDKWIAMQGRFMGLLYP